MAKLRKQNQTAHALQFILIASSDHITPLTGATPTVTISKNAGAFATPAGAVSEIANGWYQIAGNATDSNTLGSLIVHATATGADVTDSEFQIVAFDPDVTYITAGTGVNQLNVNSGIAGANIQQILGVAVTTADGTAQSGTTTSITLSASDGAANGAYVDRVITFGSGTGQGQSAVITAYNSTTKVATLHKTLSVAPDSTTQYTIGDTSVTDGFTGAATNGLIATNFVAAPTTNQIQSAILASTNTVFTDASGRVKALDSSGNSFVYTSPNSVANITNLANLDAAVSSRLPTTSYSAAPGTSAIQSAILNSTNTIATAAGGVLTVGTNNDKTGYSLSGTMNFTNTGSLGSTTINAFSGAAATTINSIATNAAQAQVNTVDLPTMISAQKFTTNALSNAPTGSGGGSAPPSVTIHVSDGTSAVVGATVAVFLNGVSQLSATTDSSGNVSTSLTPNYYALTITKAGFTKQNPLVFRVVGNGTANFVLQP